MNNWGGCLIIGAIGLIVLALIVTQAYEMQEITDAEYSQVVEYGNLFTWDLIDDAVRDKKITRREFEEIKARYNETSGPLSDIIDRRKN